MSLKTERTPLPLPTTRREQVELLAAAGFTAAEVGALSNDQLLLASHRLVYALAEFVHDDEFAMGYDLRVPNNDPIRALRELTPEQRTEIRRDANVSFAHFIGSSEECQCKEP